MTVLYIMFCGAWLAHSMNHDKGNDKSWARLVYNAAMWPHIVGRALKTLVDAQR